MLPVPKRPAPAADGIEVIVMEYVAGVTFDRRTSRHGKPPGELLDFAIQIADALAKAHSAGIVPRDLKPGNIMVTGKREAAGGVGFGIRVANAIEHFYT